MDIQAQKWNETLFCLKHKEQITMFIMDSQVPFKDTLLCSECLEENNIVCNKLISLSKAKQIIQEKYGKLNQDLNQQTKASNNLLQQLEELHLNHKDNNQKQILEKIINTHLSEQLQNEDELNKCKQNQNYILGQVDYTPKKCQQINNMKQVENCYALAFNQTGSIMVAGCGIDIKVWKFDAGKLTELNKLSGHTKDITCLVFSKNLSWFVSGSLDNTIRGWKEQQNDWVSTQPQQQHSLLVYCLLLNSNENEIISCSADKTIKVWNVECSENLIKFNYQLDNKHKDRVLSISLNQNETALISCGHDKTIILWTKGQNNKWEYINHIREEEGFRICFVSDTQMLFQPCDINQTQIFNIENNQIIQYQKIDLKEDNQDDVFFPTIFNKKKQVIIQKFDKYVNIIQKQADDTYKIVLEPIDCQSYSNFGTLTEDGEYLLIWDKNTKEFRVHQIFY